MDSRLLALLACPLEGSNLVSVENSAGERLRCSEGHEFPIRKGIPRLGPEADGIPPGDSPSFDEGEKSSEQVRRTFEYQWRSFSKAERIFGKDRDQMRELVTGARVGSRIDSSFYRGKTVLDAGCGHGRYAMEFARLGAYAVGLDVGDHLEMAAAAVPDAIADRVAFVQGDLRSAPFLPRKFDLVFCDGVLHHTRDPRRSFGRLAELVAGGGGFYVWLYPRGGKMWEGVNLGIRGLTTRMPAPLLKGLCYGLVPLLSVVPSYSQTRLGRAGWGECAQVIFDWLGPSLQSHHTEEEVRAWFDEEGLGRLEVLPVPVGMIGWRESTSAGAMR